MDEMNLDELRELIEFLKANDIAEFEREQGEAKLRIKFATALPANDGIDAGQLARLLASAVGSSVPAPVVAAQSYAADQIHAAPPVSAVTLHQVKSPIVGTFYDSPSPGSAPFVRVGDVVEVGQVLCIVEAMKLMNEIESDATGEVIERIAITGQPVEYGQPLFSIKAT